MKLSLPYFSAKAKLLRSLSIYGNHSARYAFLLILPLSLAACISNKQDYNRYPPQISQQNPNYNSDPNYNPYSSQQPSAAQSDTYAYGYPQQSDTYQQGTNIPNYDNNIAPGNNIYANPEAEAGYDPLLPNFNGDAAQQEEGSFQDNTPTVAVSEQDALGVWLVQSSKDNCRLALSLTRWNTQYRANPMQCVGEGVSSIRGWNIMSGALTLYDEAGTPIGRLGQVATGRLQGQIRGEGFLLLTR